MCIKSQLSFNVQRSFLSSRLTIYLVLTLFSKQGTVKSRQATLYERKSINLWHQS